MEIVHHNLQDEQIVLRAARDARRKLHPDRAGEYQAFIERWIPKTGYGGLISTQASLSSHNGVKLLETNFESFVNDDFLGLVFREMIFQTHDPPDELKPPTHIDADDIFDSNDLKDSMFVLPAEITDQADQQFRMQQSVEWYLKMLNHLLNTRQRNSGETLIRYTLFRDGGEKFKVTSFKFAMPRNRWTCAKMSHFDWRFIALLQIEISENDSGRIQSLQGLSNESYGEKIYRVPETKTSSTDLNNYSARQFAVSIEKWDPESDHYDRLTTAQAACGFRNGDELLVLTTFHLLVHNDLLELVCSCMRDQNHDLPDELRPPTYIVADDFRSLEKSLFVLPAEITDQADQQLRLQQSGEWYLKMLNHLLNSQLNSGKTLIRCSLVQESEDGFKIASFKFALPYKLLTDAEMKLNFGWPYDALLLQIELSDTDSGQIQLLQGLSHENCGERIYRVKEVENFSRELVNDYDRRADTITWWLKGNQVHPQCIIAPTAADTGYTPNAMYTGTKDRRGEIMQFSVAHDASLTRNGDSGRGVFIKNKSDNYYKIIGMLTCVQSDYVYSTLFYCQPVSMIINRLKELYPKELNDLKLLRRDLNDVDTAVTTETLHECERWHDKEDMIKIKPCGHIWCRFCFNNKTSKEQEHCPECHAPVDECRVLMQEKYAKASEEAGVTRLSEPDGESEPEDNNVKGESEDTVETRSEELKEIEAEPMPQKGEGILPEEAGVIGLSEPDGESKPEDNVKGESEDSVESRNQTSWGNERSNSKCNISTSSKENAVDSVNHKGQNTTLQVAREEDTEEIGGRAKLKKKNFPSESQVYRCNSRTTESQGLSEVMQWVEENKSLLQRMQQELL